MLLVGLIVFLVLISVVSLNACFIIHLSCVLDSGTGLARLIGIWLIRSDT